MDKVNQRVKPITYAEALEAKKIFEETGKQILMEENKTDEYTEIDNSVSTLNSIEIQTLPSKGKAYPVKSTIYFSPLTFGELKFLSGSTLEPLESIEFFLKKIQCNFDKNEITYFDFYYIVVLIKMSTYGTNEYNINFQCKKCKQNIKNSFSVLDLDFDEIQTPVPAIIKRNDEKLEDIQIYPLSIGKYRKLIINNLTDDYDAYMASQIKNYDFDESLKIIKEELCGINTNLLETIDELFYHGVKDIIIKCNNILPVSEEKSIGDEEVKEEGVISSGEVCGASHAIPFQSLTKYISATDGAKESLRDRIHFGL